MNINDKLNELYSFQIDGLRKISDKSDVISEEGTYSKWDGPHLMYCWEQDYKDAHLKILFIGQENNAFYDCAWDQIKKPIDKYAEFALAEKNEHSLFWQAVYEIKSLLNPKSENSKNFLWTNVSKYSTWEGKRITDEDFHFINKNLNLLESEISIINPDIVIFFSGPDYDRWIKAQFSSTVQFDEKVLSTIPARELSFFKVVEEDCVLPNRTYRTYHPNYLNRSKKWYFLNAIALDCMGLNFNDILDKIKSDFKSLKNVRFNVDEISNNFGCRKSTVKLEVISWKNFSIGFQFQENAFCSFFYGILNDKEIEDEKIINEINLLMTNNEKPTKLWPYWNWHGERNWTKKTFEEIESGEFIKNIQEIVNNLLERANGWSM